MPFGSAWRCRDTGVFPGANWTNVTFSDNTWSNGPAQLGYGDGDEARVVGFGASPANKFLTTWFRKTFTIADPYAWNALGLRYTRDDGAAIYLNGVEVVRDNLPGGVTTPTTLALAAVTAGEESRVFTTNLNPALLVAGPNILAVAIQQDSTNSSDLSFDLELTGYGAAALPALRWAPTGGNWSLQWPGWATGYTLYACTNMTTGNWLPQTNGIITAGGLAAVFPERHERRAVLPLEAVRGSPRERCTSRVLGGRRPLLCRGEHQN